MNEIATYPSLKNKVVLVTGGAQGIGESIVEQFIKQQSKVAFLDIDEKAAENLVNKIKLEYKQTPLFIKCDLKDIDQLKNSISLVREKLGSISVLVNNAANDERHEFLDTTHEYFDWEYQTNLKPHVFAAKAIIKSMIKLGGGSVINVGSIGWMRKNEKTILYGVFKSSLHGLTHGLAKRFGKDRIRVNTLVPGWTMTKKQIEVHLDEEGEKKIKEGQCLPDKVLPQDIANAALFLASDDSKMITSQDIVVDGGWT